MTSIRASAEVQAALDAGRGVVALETTVITHGLPGPDGLASAREMESAVRARGAVPAIIGALNGRVIVGMSAAEIERLAMAEGAMKLNPSNLAAGLASGDPGSLTVAATLLAAHRCRIRVFATGGIGGIHRDFAETGDASADLLAMARYPVAVVCAGAKAILDLRRTREALETLGVPVFGYGTAELPAFYRRGSGLAVDARFDSMPDLARAVRRHFELGLGTAVLVGNPIPVDFELSAEVCDRAIERALAAASGVSGRDVTPFVLDEMSRLTEGRSVIANRALLRNNAAVAAALACALPLAADPSPVLRV